MAEDYVETTRSVRVGVRSFYVADQSHPEDSHYVWAYRIRIENMSIAPVQLISRTWTITNSLGRTQTIHGEGVIGQQPILEAGESFEYTSGTPLETPSGFMAGIYHMMEIGSGETFDVAIPAFSLDSPFASTCIH